jgi:hypothetical protein
MAASPRTQTGVIPHRDESADSPDDGSWYASEAHLVRAFIDAILRLRESPFDTATIGEEFDYRSGRADVITVTWDGEVVAFEAKLSRWRAALHQAYRNTCFAHHSYVLLPWNVAARAATFQGEFDQRGVGICSLRNGALVKLVEAPRHEPLLPWLADKAVEHANIQDTQRRRRAD